jgi:hypothetical protein
VIAHEQFQVMGMVWPLELAVGYLQKLAGKISRMPVTFSTAIVPQPMQVSTSGIKTTKKHQHCEQDGFA